MLLQLNPKPVSRTQPATATKTAVLSCAITTTCQLPPTQDTLQWPGTHAAAATAAPGSAADATACHWLYTLGCHAQPNAALADVCSWWWPLGITNTHHTPCTLRRLNSTACGMSNPAVAQSTALVNTTRSLEALLTNPHSSSLQNCTVCVAVLLRLISEASPRHTNTLCAHTQEAAACKPPAVL